METSLKKRWPDFQRFSRFTEGVHNQAYENGESVNKLNIEGNNRLNQKPTKTRKGIGWDEMKDEGERESKGDVRNSPEASQATQ